MASNPSSPPPRQPPERDLTSDPAAAPVSVGPRAAADVSIDPGRPQGAQDAEGRPAEAPGAGGTPSSSEAYRKSPKRALRCREHCTGMLVSVSIFAALTGLLMGYDMCIVAVVLDPVDRDFKLCGENLACGSKTLFVSILAPGAVVRLRKP